MPSKDQFHDQAVALVPAAGVAAVSSFVPLLDQYSFLRGARAEVWDFFATAAAIFIALNNLKAVVAPERFLALYSELLPKVQQWDERGEDAVLDCQKFVARTVSPDVSPLDALGFWVLWNVLQREPSAEEARATRTVGSALSAPFQDWWESAYEPPCTPF